MGDEVLTIWLFSSPCNKVVGRMCCLPQFMSVHFVILPCVYAVIIFACTETDAIVRCVKVAVDDTSRIIIFHVSNGALFTYNDDVE